METSIFKTGRTFEYSIVELNGNPKEIENVLGIRIGETGSLPLIEALLEGPIYAILQTEKWVNVFGKEQQKKTIFGIDVWDALKCPPFIRWDICNHPVIEGCCDTIAYGHSGDDFGYGGFMNVVAYTKKEGAEKMLQWIKQVDERQEKLTNLYNTGMTINAI